MKTKKNKLKKYIPIADRLTYSAAFIEAVIVLPQVYRIFSTKSADDISLLTWTGFQILNGVWLFYGIVHRNKVIMFYTLSYGTVQMFVIIGGLMYGATWL